MNSFLERFSLKLNQFNQGILISVLIWFDVRWVLTEDGMNTVTSLK